MHELGIVFYVIDQVEDLAKKNKAKKVLGLTLEVGEVSSIIPSYFKECYEWAIKKTTYMQECKLNLVVIAGVSYCNKCKKTYSTTKTGRTCPYCGSEDTYLVTGNDVSIRDIKIVN
jgi:hydrogenase nickel incorporation protein HypA/HybF